MDTSSSLLSRLRHSGRNAYIYPGAKIVCPENISLGEETVVDDFCFLYATGKGIEVGDYSHICVGTIILAGGKVKIGRFSALSPGCRLLAETDSYDGNGFVGLKVFGNKYRDTKFLDVTLGDHVHVGMGSIIMPGVTLHDGVSIGAGSLVTKDMPEWSICYGHPAKPMKSKRKEKQLQMEKDFLEERRVFRLSEAERNNF